MTSGGNPTIIVSDFDRSIHFYTEVLGLRLTNRFGNDWATVSAGEGLTIGIHPASGEYPPPGTKGAVLLGIDVAVSIESAVARLKRFKVSIKGSIARREHGNFVSLEDSDGNEIYLWERTRAAIKDAMLAEVGA